MNQEIKVTKCNECPMMQFTGWRSDYVCAIDTSITILSGLQIHPNCPLKGKSITYKIGENE